MFRRQFVDVVTNTGMVTLKDIRPLAQNKDANVVSELELVKFPNFKEVDFAKAIAKKYSLTFIDLTHAKISEEIISILPKKVILKYRAIPIQKTAKSITVVSFDPTVMGQINEIQNIFKHPVDLIITTLTSWGKLFSNVTETVDELLETMEEVKAGEEEDEEVLKEEDIGQDVITYVNKTLAEAYVKKASDIHIECYENNFRIRMRVDGSLIEMANPPRSLMLPIISRLKIMSQMDIAERRLPQDGRIKIRIGDKAVDFRVSSLPTLFGEKIVLRILDQSNLQLDMTKLGFEENQLKDFLNGIRRPYGMCLVTGPTGSGKTTTLYSALADLNKPTSNISTAEDPVEFNLEGINQVNVRKDIGLTFASALKAFLRQDPDIIMVGEIRDIETGEIAIEAALTGHLVLSTLHTNDAPSTITRLLNMGIEPFLVNAALNVVVAQRLCRRICTQCKVPRPTKPQELIDIGVAPASAQKMKVFTGKGCTKCNNTGYKGRVAIYEVLLVSPRVRELILKGASSDEIKVAAIKDGMKTLRMSALTKVAMGLTTIEEAVSTSSADNV